MPDPSLTVAWISDFPLEWLDGLPPAIAALPRQHPLSWKRVLLGELETDPRLRIHVIVLRKHIARSVTFSRGRVTFHVLRSLPGTRAPSLYWADTYLISRVLARVKPDLVHAWGNERGAGLVASRLPYPYLLTVQGLLGDIAARGGSTRSLRMQLFVRLEMVSLRRARHVSAESSYAIEYLRRRYPRLVLHRIEHAPDRLFHQVVRHASKELSFLAVGTVGRGKGSDLLLQALGRLGLPFEALIIGTIDRAFVAPILAGVPPAVRANIRFESERTPAGVAQAMAAATMLLLPSRAENSPNVVKEAAVIGVPVVATAVGGIAEHVTSGQNGVLCSVASADAFVEAIEAACRDPQLSRGDVDPATLARVRSRLSPERMAEQFLRAYRAVLPGTHAFAEREP